MESALQRALGLGRFVFLAAVLSVTSASAQAPTTELKPRTTKVFDEYIETVEETLQKRVDGQLPFFVIDEKPELRVQVEDGELAVLKQKVETNVPDGIIHNWTGAMFIPGATLARTREVLMDFDRHKDYYPEVIRSKLMSRKGNVYRGLHRLLKEKVLTAVLDASYEARVFPLGDKRWHSQTRSTRIAEIKDAGEPDERELPVGSDSGFLWRTNTGAWNRTRMGCWRSVKAFPCRARFPSGWAG